MRRRNVVLTVLPRGGATLTCHLLNQLPDTVTLHEPQSNRKPVYDRKRMRLLGEGLQEREGAYLRFYYRESLKDQLEKAF